MPKSAKLTFFHASNVTVIYPQQQRLEEFKTSTV